MINRSINVFMGEFKILRLKNKNKWFWHEALVNGQHVKIKCYNTYLQVFTVDGCKKESGTMDMTVTQLNDELLRGLKNDNAY